MLKNKADRATRALLREISRDNVELFSALDSAKESSKESIKDSPKDLVRNSAKDSKDSTKDVSKDSSKEPTSSRTVSADLPGNDQKVNSPFLYLTPILLLFRKTLR